MPHHWDRLSYEARQICLTIAVGNGWSYSNKYTVVDQVLWSSAVPLLQVTPLPLHLMKNTMQRKQTNWTHVIHKVHCCTSQTNWTEEHGLPSSNDDDAKLTEQPVEVLAIFITKVNWWSNKTARQLTWSQRISRPVSPSFMIQVQTSQHQMQTEMQWLLLKCTVYTNSIYYSLKENHLIQEECTCLCKEYQLLAFYYTTIKHELS